jgi:hypothetical protein
VETTTMCFATCVDRLHTSLKGEQLPLFPYFGCPVGDQDKPWASHVRLSTCAVYLRVWITGTRHAMPFAFSEVWREIKEYVCDYYFCLTPASGHSSTTKHIIYYPNLSLVLR